MLLWKPSRTPRKKIIKPTWTLITLSGGLPVDGRFARETQPKSVASISDKKGSRTEFSYTFNMSGYVETITATHFSEGIKTPTKQVYTIFYQGF